MTKIFISFCLLVAISFFSCKKDDNTVTWIEGSQDYALAEAFLQEIFKIVDEAAKTNSEVYKLASLDCATITLEADTSGDFPKTLIIDYGLVNCIGGDGRKRRGEVKATFNGQYSEPGTTVNISLDNFFINNYRVTSNNLVISNTSNLIQTQHHINFPSLRFLNPAGQAIDINGSRTFVLIEGDGTQSSTDDLFQISGSFSVNDILGSDFTATITDPLLLNYECRSIISGSLNLSLPDADGIFNYGMGECDDKATVIFDGRTFFIDLE